jgi:hypothetical protein
MFTTHSTSITMVIMLALIAAGALPTSALDKLHKTCVFLQSKSRPCSSRLWMFFAYIAVLFELSVTHDLHSILSHADGDTLRVIASSSLNTLITTYSTARPLWRSTASYILSTTRIISRMAAAPTAPRDSAVRNATVLWTRTTIAWQKGSQSWDYCRAREATMSPTPWNPKSVAQISK